MPSFIKNALAVSLGIRSLSNSPPELVSFSSPTTGGSLIATFSSGGAHLLISQQLADKTWTLLSVFSARDDQVVICDWIKEEVEHYKVVDDVFEDAFLQVLYIQGEATPESGLAACLADAFGTEAVLTASTSKHPSDVPKGPYVAYTTEGETLLGQVYRVYQDDHQAFMNGVSSCDATIGIPVPSRLYGSAKSNDSKSLARVRVTVKDIIDIAGIKTTNGNRAWSQLYPVRNSTAPSIQALIDVGAVIIGKTKTAQFANSDRPTADWVDYHDAFNPRGDGYQDPGVSSSGAGASTAAYDWLDVGIGTDTGGSVRIPASKQGLFALRPSFGATSNEGAMPEGEYFDAVGFMTRSPYLLQTFGRAWLSQAEQQGELALSTNRTSFPRRLIVPSNLWPVESNSSQVVFSNWISRLATTLNASIDTTSTSEFWNATAHADLPDTNFETYMHEVGFNLIWQHQLSTVIEPFERDYAAAYDGRTPFINPFPTARYASAANVTEAMAQEAYDRFTYFRDWFGRHVVRSDPHTCSESLFLIPMFAGEVSYRNIVYSPPDVSTWTQFTKYYYSVQSQGPEAVFPIGQVGHMSNVTNVEEQLPVAIDVLAHRGCDLMLLDLAARLADEGLLREVKTGRTAF